MPFPRLKPLLWLEAQLFGYWFGRCHRCGRWTNGNRANGESVEEGPGVAVQACCKRPATEKTYPVNANMRAHLDGGAR